MKTAVLRAIYSQDILTPIRKLYENLMCERVFMLKKVKAENRSPSAVKVPESWTEDIIRPFHGHDNDASLLRPICF